MGDGEKATGSVVFALVFVAISPSCRRFKTSSIRGQLYYAKGCLCLYRYDTIGDIRLDKLINYVASLTIIMPITLHAAS
jgi:hypothetical protein